MQTDPDIGINQAEDNDFDNERAEMLAELHKSTKKD